MKIQVLLAAFCSLGAINAAVVNEVDGIEIRDYHHSTTRQWQTSKTTAKSTAKTTPKTSAKTTKKTTTCSTTSKKSSKTTTTSPTTKKATTSLTTTEVTTTTPVLTTPVITTPVITTPSTTLLTTTSSALPACFNIGQTCAPAAANLCCSGNCDPNSLSCCSPFRGTCDFNNGPPGQCCSPYVCGRTNVCVED